MILHKSNDSKLSSLLFNLILSWLLIAVFISITAQKKGLRVVVLEKARSAGGTTAISGGVAWVPNNHVMKREGFTDSKDNSLK